MLNKSASKDELLKRSKSTFYSNQDIKDIKDIKDKNKDGKLQKININLDK